MQVSILACDLCARHKHAVGTVKVDLGTNGALQRDFCKKHMTQFMRFLRASQTPDAKVERHGKRFDYEQLEAEALKFAGKFDTFQAVEFAKAAGIRTGIAQKTVARLIKAKKLKATGHGPGRKVTKA